MCHRPRWIFPVHILTWHHYRRRFESIRIEGSLSVGQKRVVFGTQVVDVQAERAFSDDVHGENAKGPAHQKKMASASTGTEAKTSRLLLFGVEFGVGLLCQGRQLGDQLFGAFCDQRRHLVKHKRPVHRCQSKSKYLVITETHSFDFSGGERGRNGRTNVLPFLVYGGGQHFAEILFIGNAERLNARIEFAEELSNQPTTVKRRKMRRAALRDGWRSGRSLWPTGSAPCRRRPSQDSVGSRRKCRTFSRISAPFRDRIRLDSAKKAQGIAFFVWSYGIDTPTFFHMPHMLPKSGTGFGPRMPWPAKKSKFWVIHLSIVAEWLEHKKSGTIFFVRATRGKGFWWC